MTTFNKIWQIAQTRCGVSLFGARDPRISSPHVYNSSRKLFLHKKLNPGSTCSLNLYYIVFVSVREAFRSPIFSYMKLSVALINFAMAAGKKSW